MFFHRIHLSIWSSTICNVRDPLFAHLQNFLPRWSTWRWTHFDITVECHPCPAKPIIWEKPPFVPQMHHFLQRIRVNGACFSYTNWLLYPFVLFICLITKFQPCLLGKYFRRNFHVQFGVLLSLNILPYALVSLFVIVVEACLCSELQFHLQNDVLAMFDCQLYATDGNF